MATSSYSIIFIPGLKGSKLYNTKSKTDIWPPSILTLLINNYVTSALCKLDINNLLDMNNVIPNGLVEKVGHRDI